MTAAPSASTPIVSAGRPAPPPGAAWRPDDDTTVELGLGPRHDTPTVLLLGTGGFVLMVVLVALLTQQPHLLAVGAPSLGILLFGLFEGRYPRVRVEAKLDAPRALEGELTRLTVTLTTSDRAVVAEIETAEMPGFEPVATQRYVVWLGRRRTRTVVFAMIPQDWGVMELPAFTVRARSAAGLFASAQRYRCTTSLRVHINEEPARSMLEPIAFRRVVGGHVSNDRNEGCEIADVRPYQAGDRLQAINWRISARHPEPWITLRHPDRSTTVVIVVDAYASFGEGPNATLRRSVRAAMGLARLHIGAQDPVGLLLVGHGRRWIEPQLGRAHLSATTDALLELSTTNWGERHRNRQGLDQMIPIDAEVVVVSSLLNDAIGQALIPLLARSQQVHIIEPVYELPSVLSVPENDRENGDPTLAWRVFTLEQQLRRRTLTSMGASVAAWEPDEPVEATLLALRRARRARQVTTLGRRR